MAPPDLFFLGRAGHTPCARRPLRSQLSEYLEGVRGPWPGPADLHRRNLPTGRSTASSCAGTAAGRAGGAPSAGDDARAEQVGRHECGSRRSWGQQPGRHGSIARRGGRSVLGDARGGDHPAGRDCARHPGHLHGGGGIGRGPGRRPPGAWAEGPSVRRRGPRDPSWVCGRPVRAAPPPRACSGPPPVQEARNRTRTPATRRPA